MKTVTLLLIGLITILPGTFLEKSLKPTQIKISNEEVFHDFIKKYEQFLDQLSKLQETISIGDLEDIQREYRELRIRFKQVEPLLAYYFESEYNLYFNGAPLPKLEPNVPEITVLEPKGMQVIDEIVFGEPEANKEFLEDLVQELISEANKTKKILLSLEIQDVHMLEACRSELLRLTSLGLSGFDTPGSGLFVEDAKVVTREIRQLMSNFQNQMSEDEKRILELLDSFYLKLNSILDNDEVDHVDLIRNFISPLYKMIKDFHLQSGIEHAREIYGKKAPLNYYADHIFSGDFLNVDPFSRIGEREQSPVGIELGGKLFYDPVMSRDWKSSCASCHSPELGFSDGKAKSSAFNGTGVLMRNAPTLINSILATKYFHDLRAVKPSLQIDHVVYNPDEFNIDYVEITDRLNTSAEYRKLFEEAFPHMDGVIQRYTITNAITQFVASLVGMDSEFDRYMRGETTSIDPSVYRGFNLFMGKAACASCHFVPVFNGTVPPSYKDTESEILGVLSSNDFENPQLDNDPGRMANGDVRQESEIYYRSFKTPTVRNVTLTAPYMHNGVHGTLEEVLRFYNSGGGQGLGLDVPYQTLPPDSLGLSEEEIGHIISFMHALTDTAGMTGRPKLPFIPGHENRGGEEY